MPAERLAILAGRGRLPESLAEVCQQQNRPYLIVAFTGQTDAAWAAQHPHVWTRLGAVGKTLRLLKQHQAKTVVLAGGMRRPDLHSLCPDGRALRILARAGWQGLGDDRLLRLVMAELEREGVQVVGAHTLLQDLLLSAGALGRHTPTQAQLADIALGQQAARLLGSLDIGQSVIVQEGRIIGVEGAEGTDALIARCAAWTQGRKVGVLVKTAKPHQDTRADLPALGPETVAQAAAAGLVGIAGEAGRTLLLDAPQAVAAADKAGVFLYGF
jgi:DUF1009 family protein